MPVGQACAKPHNEVLLNSLLGALLTEGLIAPGALLDAGTFNGEWACYIADKFRQRAVYAVDPLASNVALVERLARRGRPNLHTLVGGLADETRQIVYTGITKFGYVSGMHRF